MKLSITLSAFADYRFHGDNDGTGQRYRILPVCRLSRGLQRKGRRRAASAGGRARGGDPRRRPGRHTHEPWRSGGSRRLTLIGLAAIAPR
jgi:hypothetical protein